MITTILGGQKKEKGLTVRYASKESRFGASMIEIDMYIYIYTHAYNLIFSSGQTTYQKRHSFSGCFLEQPILPATVPKIHGYWDLSKQAIRRNHCATSNT